MYLLAINYYNNLQIVWLDRCTTSVVLIGERENACERAKQSFNLVLQYETIVNRRESAWLQGFCFHR